MSMAQGGPRLDRDMPGELPNSNESPGSIANPGHGESQENMVKRHQKKTKLAQDGLFGGG